MSETGWTLTYGNADLEVSETFATRLDAMDAADTAAASHGLTAVYGAFDKGKFADAQGVGSYFFRIEQA